MNVWNLYMKSWPGHVKIIRFLLAHKLISLCMASVNDCRYSHGINIRVHYFKTWCATFKRMSLIHYGKCLLVFIWLHYYWISLFQSLCMQFHSSVQYDMHSCIRCNLAFFCLCMHSLYHPWPSTEKGSGGLPRVHRLLCGLPRVHRGLRTLLPGTPQCSDQAVTTAASWVDGCAAPLRRWCLDRCGDAGK